MRLMTAEDELQGTRRTVHPLQSVACAHSTCTLCFCVSLWNGLHLVDLGFHISHGLVVVESLLPFGGCVLVQLNLLSLRKQFGAIKRYYKQ